MQKLVAMAVLVILVAAGSQTARAGSPGAHRGPTVRTATINPLSGTPVSVVTRLQPVVGSVQRTSHFSNPLTHKAKYTSTTYNPVLGTFGTQKFKR